MSDTPGTWAGQAPAGACDCHIHIVENPSLYPMAADRRYTPTIASLDDMDRLHARLGIERFVIVTPTVYGTDNRSTLAVLGRAPGRSRGVAVIAPDESAASLRAMDEAGVRGVRLNLVVSPDSGGGALADRLRQVAGQVADLGWHLQLNTGLDVIGALATTLQALPVPVVFDHYAHAQGAGGATQPGFDALLRLLAGGRAYVKLSAPYHSSRLPDYADLVPLAQACMRANPERVLWGSNWPHPDLRNLTPENAQVPRGYLDIDDDGAFGLLWRWADEPAQRRQVLVDNPARLYGF